MIFLIFIIWAQFMPKQEKLDDQQEQTTGAAEKAVDGTINEDVERQTELPEDGTGIAVTQQEHQMDSLSEYHALQKQFGMFVNSSEGNEEFIIVENEVIKMLFSSRGGRVYSVELKDYKTYDTSRPVILFDSESNKFGYSFHSKYPLLVDTLWTLKDVELNTNNLYFETVLPQQASGGNRFELSKNDTLRLSFRLFPDQPKGSGKNDGKYLEFVYNIYGDQYMIDHTLNLVNLENIVFPQYDELFELYWQTDMKRHEKTQDQLNGTTIYFREEAGSKIEFNSLSENKNDIDTVRGNLKWISLKQRFFCSTIISKEKYFTGARISQFEEEKTEDDGYFLPTMTVKMDVLIDNVSNHSSNFSFYFGPLKYNELRSYDLGLERQIPLGWSFPYVLSWINRFAVIPVFNWLGGYGWNYGIVILVLTIMLKIVLFPIAYKTYRSTAKMRVLKPEIDEIAKKFPKKEDAMKKQQATMALYKKAGVNPMAGCVPMLLQFPILIAMFRFFPSSIELRQQPFLWANDLSSYDSIATLPFEIPYYGDHVSLFTLLMTVSTIIYTWMNNQMMSSSQQLPGMKTMMYLMPVMFLAIFNSYASGLSYYYLLANLFTFGQMFVIRRTINEEKIYQKLQENKKKPKKQSGFQKRLEEAAKKYNNPPRRK